MEKTRAMIKINNRKDFTHAGILFGIGSIGVLILLTFAVSEYIMLFVFLALTAYILLAKVNNSIAIMIGLVPFSEVFLFRGFDVFYILVAVLALKIVLTYPIKASRLVTIIAFGVYYMLTLDYTQDSTFSLVLGLINVLAVLLVISNIDKLNLKVIFKVFLFGLLLSTIVGGLALKVESFAKILSHTFIEGKFRFAGLAWDTNFYAAMASLAVAISLVMMEADKKHLYLYAFYGIFFLIMGVLTMSKMYILSIALVFVWWLLFSGAPFSAKLALISGLLIAGVLLLIFSPADSSFKLLIDRMLQFFTGEVTLNRFTTGRIDLWMMYIKEMFQRPLVLMFGAGINVTPHVTIKAVHNTYLEIIWSFGLFGAALFFLALYCACKKTKIKGNKEAQYHLTKRERKRKKFHFIGLLCIAFIFLTLSGFTNISFMWLIFLAVALSKIPFGNERRSLGKNKLASEEQI